MSNTSYNVQLDVSNFPRSVKDGVDHKTFRMLLVSELADNLAIDMDSYNVRSGGVQLDKQESGSAYYRFSFKLLSERNQLSISDIMEVLASYNGKWQILSDVADEMVGGHRHIPQEFKSQKKGFWRPKISIQKVWA